MSNVGDVNDMTKNALVILNKENLPTFKKNSLSRAKDFDISNILPQYEKYYQKVMDKASTYA
jgi:hypothetical protein